MVCLTVALAFKNVEMVGDPREGLAEIPLRFAEVVGWFVAIKVELESFSEGV
jgi:hypothetical protein